MRPPKGVPIDSISKSGMGTIEVQSVQIGPMAISVPPGSLKKLGAAG